MITFPPYHCDPSRIDSTIEFIIDKYNYPEIDINGNKTWRNKEGQRHRLNGPARIYADGRLEYWENGKLHRDDGPAGIYPDGTLCYFQNDKRHRLDGPAVICPNGTKEFWEYGVRIK